MICKSCMGYGIIDSVDNRCADCKGTGEAPKLAAAGQPVDVTCEVSKAILEILDRVVDQDLPESSSLTDEQMEIIFMRQAFEEMAKGNCHRDWLDKHHKKFCKEQFEKFIHKYFNFEEL